MTDHGARADDLAGDALAVLAWEISASSDLEKMQLLSRANTLAILSLSHRLADVATHPDIRVANDYTSSDTPPPSTRGPHDHGARHR